MRASLSSVATTIVVSLLVSGCASATSPAPVTTSPQVWEPRGATPPLTSSPATSEPTGTPIAVIDHATGPADILLRFDNGPGDYGICELCGGWSLFTPGPEFTLYGDGTVIVRNELAKPPPAEGPIMRAHPFRSAHLDEDQVQSLLRFAIGEGGLGTARERYNTRVDNDETGHAVFTIRAGGLDKTVEIGGNANPFEALADHLLNIDRDGNVPTQVWAPDRYWGLLIEVTSLVEVGVLPDPGEANVVPWPWPEIPPWVSGSATFPGPEIQRRAMQGDEAAVLGLADNGGVVQRIYLRGPDDKTIYSFSLWPMLPDETG
jgi:hypothetical protein